MNHLRGCWRITAPPVLNLIDPKLATKGRACNNDGVWNEEGATLNFTILPAFYQTLLFRAASILIILLLFFGLVRLFYRWRISQATERLSTHFEARLMERTRIAQELHDTLLQGVVSSAMQLDVVTENLGESSPAKPMLDHINGLMANVITEGRNALKGLRSPYGHRLANMEEELANLKVELGISDDVDFHILVKGQSKKVEPVIYGEIYQITREALINAFRHSGADRIEIELEYAAKHLRILVRDNGCGIDQKILESGREGHWGLSGIRERAKRIGSSVRLWSKPGAGTEIELSVPNHVAFPG